MSRGGSNRVVDEEAAARCKALLVVGYEGSGVIYVVVHQGMLWEEEMSEGITRDDEFISEGVSNIVHRSKGKSDIAVCVVSAPG
jgi:hypothetical protein